MSEFTAEYYRSGNYSDYLDRGERYVQLARDLAPKLDGRILDFGCGVGFLMRGLRRLGLDARGYDTSEWAVQYGTDVLYVEEMTTQSAVLYPAYDNIIGLDVFEHIPVDELHTLFQLLQTRQLIVRIPVAAAENEDFVLEVSRNDRTHVTCWTKDQWHAFFQQYGYQMHELLQLPTIWDAPGVLSCIYRRSSHHAESIPEAATPAGHP